MLEHFLIHFLISSYLRNDKLITINLVKLLTKIVVNQISCDKIFRRLILKKTKILVEHK